MKKFAIIRRSYMWLIGGLGIAIIAAITFYLNFSLSIEFTGGIEMLVETNVEGVEVEENLKAALIEEGYEKTSVTTNRQVDDSLNIVVNLGLTNDAQVKAASDKVQGILTTQSIIEGEDDILGLSLIGPSIGENMKSSTLWILMTALAAIAIYMMFSFSSIRSFISPSKLAIVTIVTMIFDLTITGGAYGIYMFFDPTIQVNTVFVTAMLMIMGYSINDTIIIMDRIRENINKGKDSIGKSTNYSDVFETSIWQTMRRSVGTSVSTFLVVFVLFIFAFFYNATLIQHFAFVLSVGVIAGTYSSIFLAAPLVYVLLGRFNKEHKGGISKKQKKITKKK